MALKVNLVKPCFTKLLTGTCSKGLAGLFVSDKDAVEMEDTFFINTSTVTSVGSGTRVRAPPRRQLHVLKAIKEKS